MKKISMLIRVVLCAAIVIGANSFSFAYRNDDQLYAYQPVNPTVYDFQNNFNLPQTFNNRAADFSFFNNLQTPLSPNLTINQSSMRLPEITVFDVGSSVWSFEKSAAHFNADTKSFDSYRADIKFKFNDVAAERSVSMNLGSMKFDSGTFSPREFKNVYRDEKGNTLERDRTRQTSQTNSSYYNFVQYYEKQDRLASANQSISPTATSKVRPVEPPIVLVNSFAEKWKLSTTDDAGNRQYSTIDLRVDAIQNDSDLHRFISGYTGSIKMDRQTVKFTVASPHESNGNIKSLSFLLEGKGTPSATVTWKPVEGKTSQAFLLLRENVPAPILVGPRSSFRLNGVDLVESPLHVTAHGDIADKQIGRSQDLVNLLGKEDLGITVSFSAPDSQSTKSSFSLGNSLRNLWYRATGQWSDVTNMRQQLTALRHQEPGKFLLAAGFSDPNFMGIKELRVSMANTPKELPKSAGEIKFDKEKFFVNQKGEIADISALTQDYEHLKVSAHNLEEKENSIERILNKETNISNRLMENIHQQTGQKFSDKIVQTSAVTQLKGETAVFSRKTSLIQTSLDKKDYVTADNALLELKSQQTSLTSKQSQFMEQLASLKDFRGYIAELNTAMSALLPQINQEQMIEQKIDANVIAKNGVNYFSDLKVPITKQTKNTLNALSTLVDQGLIAPSIALVWGTSIIEARNRLVAATPSSELSYQVGKEAKEFASHPATVSANSLSQAEDNMFFTHVNQLAQANPVAGEFIGKAGLKLSQSAVFISEATSIAGLAYFAVVAPILTAGSYAIGNATQYALKSNGVNDEAAGFWGGAASLAAAIGLAKSPTVTNADKITSTKAIGALKQIPVGNIVENMKTVGSYFMDAFSNPMKSQRGSILLSRDKTELPQSNKFEPHFEKQVTAKTQINSESVLKPYSELPMEMKVGAKWQYDAINPGPLNETIAKTFFGGKYNQGITHNTHKFWRGGDISNPKGNFMSFEPPQSIAKVRIDNAVRPQWIEKTSGQLNGVSPINHAISVEIPPGTVYYYGPTSNQGEIFNGGIDRIQVYVPNARKVATFKVEYPLN